jgi:hypothetical protein
LVFAPAGSQAALITFTASGTQGGDPLSAQAQFATSAGQVVITLTNTLSPSQIVGAGSLLTDIQFTLSDLPGTVGTRSATGTEGNLGNNGNVLSSFPGLSIPRWVGLGPPPPGGTGFFNVIANVIVAEVIGGGPPFDMILPNGTSFPNANASVIGANPSVIGPLTITLALSGVTANTTVIAATFSFGTGPDHFLDGTPVPPPPIPEPATIALAVSGVATFGFAGLRRLRRQPADLTA